MMLQKPSSKSVTPVRSALVPSPELTPPPQGPGQEEGGGGEEEEEEEEVQLRPNEAVLKV